MRAGRKILTSCGSSQFRQAGYAIVRAACGGAQQCGNSRLYATKNFNARVSSVDGANASEMAPCRVLAAGGANHSMERNPAYGDTPLRFALGMKNARFAAFLTARVPHISLALARRNGTYLDPIGVRKYEKP
jgi:hypothetical protein